MLFSDVEFRIFLADVIFVFSGVGGVVFTQSKPILSLLSVLYLRSPVHPPELSPCREVTFEGLILVKDHNAPYCRMISIADNLVHSDCRFSNCSVFRSRSAEWSQTALPKRDSFLGHFPKSREA